MSDHDLSPKNRVITGILGYNGLNVQRCRGGGGTPLGATQEVSAPMCAKRITPPFPDPNPSGLCQCGCGLPVTVIALTDTKKGRYKGHHALFVQNHHHLVREVPPDPNPSGICMCGCGEPVGPIPETNAPEGRYAGHHPRFCRGHNLRSTGPDFIFEDRGYETPCWIWQRSLDEHGYARLKKRGQPRVHRIKYESIFGPVATGLILDHLCRTRSCVNPFHLEPVTSQENTQRGVSAKLTPDLVVQVRDLQGQLPSRAVGKMFGITSKAVLNIWNRKTWRNVL